MKVISEVTAEQVRKRNERNTTRDNKRKQKHREAIEAHQERLALKREGGF